MPWWVLTTIGDAGQPPDDPAVDPGLRVVGVEHVEPLAAQDAPQLDRRLADPRTGSTLGSTSAAASGGTPVGLEAGHPGAGSADADDVADRPRPPPGAEAAAGTTGWSRPSSGGRPSWMRSGQLNRRRRTARLPRRGRRPPEALGPRGRRSMSTRHGEAEWRLSGRRTRSSSSLALRTGEVLGRVVGHVHAAPARHASTAPRRGRTRGDAGLDPVGTQLVGDQHAGRPSRPGRAPWPWPAGWRAGRR